LARNRSSVDPSLGRRAPEWQAHEGTFGSDLAFQKTSGDLIVQARAARLGDLSHGKPSAPPLDASKETAKSLIRSFLYR
jgi:hypothetical protein